MHCLDGAKAKDYCATSPVLSRYFVESTTQLVIRASVCIRDCNTAVHLLISSLLEGDRCVGLWPPYLLYFETNFVQAPWRAPGGLSVPRNYLIVYLTDPVGLLRWCLRANKMLSPGVHQASSVACGRGGPVYEKRPRPASTSNDIHAGSLHWAFVAMEQSFSLCRSGWLAIRSGGYADLALALSAVLLCHPLWGRT